jgi:spore germination cell wall hydrolase CwlJ-like protein
VSLGGVSAREYYLYTDESRARAALPGFVEVTVSPVALAKAHRAAESECLAEVLYYEARGEGIEGETAVAEVVLQRTRDANYPDTVCGVVYDGVQPDRLDCQFSFACDGSSRKRKDRAAWVRMRGLAEKILTGAVRLSGATGRATAYHNVDVAPVWAETMLKTAEIGNHVFYKRDPLAQQRLAQEQMDKVQVSPDDISMPPPLITVESIVPSEEVEPEIEATGAVGNGA